MNTKEIRTTYHKDENAFYILYLLHKDKATMQFSLRCPTPKWNYYLPMDVGFHADHSTNCQRWPEDSSVWWYDQSSCKCDIRPLGVCFYDGSTLAAESLWKAFQETGDVETIWNELESWYKDKFEVCSAPTATN